MRPIKFREAILRRNGDFLRWHYWGYIQDGFVSPSLPTVSESYQFTGRLDKHGKEIYAEDRLNGTWEQFDSKGYEYMHPFNNLSVVYSDDYSCFAIPSTITKYIKHPIGNYLNFLYQVSECEVIGNKFENPELL